MLLSFLVSSLVAHATPPLPPPELLKYQSCSSDEDCVYVQNGSCDCNNGGTGVAINKSHLVEFSKLFAPAECTTIKGAACHVGIPKCEQSKCLYYARIIPRYKKKSDASK